MGAGIEWLSRTEVHGVLRMGKEFKKFGDPWDAMCLVTIEGDTLHLFAIEAKQLTAIFRERDAIKSCIPRGIKRVTWDHHGKHVEYEVNGKG